MKANLAAQFPIVLSFVLPLAGVILAAYQYTQDDRREAMRLGLAAVAGTVFWAALISS